MATGAGEPKNTLTVKGSQKNRKRPRQPSSARWVKEAEPAQPSPKRQN